MVKRSIGRNWGFMFLVVFVFCLVFSLSAFFMYQRAFEISEGSGMSRDVEAHEELFDSLDYIYNVFVFSLFLAGLFLVAGLLLVFRRSGKK